MAYPAHIKARTVRLSQEGYSDREIAAIVEVPLNTVINWRNKARVLSLTDRERVSNPQLNRPLIMCSTAYVETNERGRPVSSGLRRCGVSLLTVIVVLAVLSIIFAFAAPFIPVPRW